MKYAEAKEIMAAAYRSQFRVAFEKRDRSCLVSGYFPDRDEKPFDNEAHAWGEAMEFAATAPPEYVNIYVVDGRYRPVDGYKNKTLRPI